MSLRDWVTLCLAAGINVRNMDPLDVHTMAGKILSDTILAGKVRELCSGAVLPPGAWEEVLLSLSPAERIALRERVSGVLAFIRSA